MGNQNRKTTKEEKAHARRIIRAAFPGLTPVFGAHADYGGHRAPRDHTIAFRLQNARGKFLLKRSLGIAGQSRHSGRFDSARNGRPGER